MNLFGLYTILRHSPKEMGEYAWALAVLQVTTTCCDHITADGASPYLLFPLIVFVRLDDVDRHIHRNPDRSRVLGDWAHANMHDDAFLSSTSLHRTRRSPAENRESIYPQLRQFIMMPRFLGFARGSHTFFLVNILGFLAVCGSFMIEKRLVDEERQLIKALIIQVTIPMVTVIIPFCLGAIVIFVDNTDLTKFCPLIGLLFAQHGLCNTIAILCLYRPYREHVKRTFRRITELPSFRKCFNPAKVLRAKRDFANNLEVHALCVFVEFPAIFVVASMLRVSSWDFVAAS
ncbi:unnamed protein product, partial [Mesorhabditis belari]|uniref:G protein-coupled receptor n=1 Tax=Mesorhabditis belari TaxID=2138241 RepID=A0AAF3J2K5_9BILA